MTLFVTTHYMDEAERCTDVGYIYMSQLIVCGKPDELKQLPEVTPAGHAALGAAKSPRPTETLGALRQIAGVRDATLFGQTIHVLVDERADRRAILSAVWASRRTTPTSAADRADAGRCVRHADRARRSSDAAEQAADGDRTAARRARSPDGSSTAGSADSGREPSAVAQPTIAAAGPTDRRLPGHPAQGVLAHPPRSRRRSSSCSSSR